MNTNAILLLIVAVSFMNMAHLEEIKGKPAYQSAVSNAIGFLFAVAALVSAFIT